MCLYQNHTFRLRTQQILLLGGILVAITLIIATLYSWYVLLSIQSLSHQQYGDILQPQIKTEVSPSVLETELQTDVEKMEMLRSVSRESSSTTSVSKTEERVVLDGLSDPNPSSEMSAEKKFEILHDLSN